MVTLLGKRCFYLFGSGLLLWLLLVSSKPVYAQDPAEAIAFARQQVAVCYDAAAEAELAGGNVSVLVDTLNEAGLLLAKAELAYSTGDFGEASNLANQCLGHLSGFVNEADGLKVAGEQAKTTDFLFNVVGSVVGTCVVIGAGFGVWVYLKRHEGQAEEELTAEVARI